MTEEERETVKEYEALAQRGWELHVRGDDRGDMASNFLRLIRVRRRMSKETRQALHLKEAAS